jgi:hypothetical protein
MKKYSEFIAESLEKQLSKQRSELQRHETAYDHHEGLGNEVKMKFQADKIKEHKKKIGELVAEI